jgi:hypothetical protein
LNLAPRYFTGLGVGLFVGRTDRWPTQQTRRRPEAITRCPIAHKHLGRVSFIETDELKRPTPVPGVIVKDEDIAR